MWKIVPIFVCPLNAQQTTYTTVVHVLTCIENHNNNKQAQPQEQQKKQVGKYPLSVVS